MSILDNVLEHDAKKNKGNKRSTGFHVSKQAGNKFKEEFSENLDMNDYQRYQQNGVFFTKVSDNTATLKYEGLLAKCGADDVYTVIGFGSNTNWENVQTIRMSRSGNSFHADIPTMHGKNVNIAFKDSANNWDNNSGMNYTFI
ncbi:MAG: carbohydrate-binding family 25 protein [Clostridiaceae bacterium]|nr:carbohydrate-binding family 25 protein [Clostridiaceae bacterium]